MSIFKKKISCNKFTLQNRVCDKEKKHIKKKIKLSVVNPKLKS